VHCTCHEISGGFVLVQRIAQLRLGLLWLLRVVAAQLPQLFDRCHGVLEQLIRLLASGTIFRKGLWGALPFREHSDGFWQQYIN
jgi:hypothetical protein